MQSHTEIFACPTVPFFFLVQSSVQCTSHNYIKEGASKAKQRTGLNIMSTKHRQSEQEDKTVINSDVMNIADVLLIFDVNTMSQHSACDDSSSSSLELPNVPMVEFPNSPAASAPA
jgi:hypothetical protein